MRNFDDRVADEASMLTSRKPLRPQDLPEGDTVMITLEEIADRQAGLTSDADYPWGVMLDDCYTILRYGRRELVASLRETLLSVGKVVILDPADDSVWRE